jgi:hypothetical protein
MVATVSSGLPCRELQSPQLYPSLISASKPIVILQIVAVHRSCIVLQDSASETRVPMNTAVTSGSSSAYAKAAQLPVGGAGLGKAQTSEKSSVPSIGNYATDRLDLSDHAKAILVRARTDQGAADKLTALLQSARESVTGKQAPASKDGTQIFESLTGHNRSSPAGGEPSSAGDFEDAVLDRLIEAHRNADGTVSDYSAVARDVFTPATSAEQVSDWYKTNGQAWIDSAQARPTEWGTSLANAVQAREVTFHSAADFADLNFHNTYTFAGGEGGGSANVNFTYNQNASIFSDPTTSYLISSDGTVVSWKKAPGVAPASST